jgi:hypothetical protein
MGCTESLRQRYGAPAPRPPFVFLRDLRTEKTDGLAVAGKLIAPGWAKPVTELQRAELAAIAGRLLEARRNGHLGKLASFVGPERIRSFEVQSVAWLRRQAADALVIPVRVRAGR